MNEETRFAVIAASGGALCLAAGVALVLAAPHLVVIGLLVGMFLGMGLGIAAVLAGHYAGGRRFRRSLDSSQDDH